MKAQARWNSISYCKQCTQHTPDWNVSPVWPDIIGSVSCTPTPSPLDLLLIWALGLNISMNGGGILQTTIMVCEVSHVNKLALLHAS